MEHTETSPKKSNIIIDGEESTSSSSSSTPHVPHGEKSTQGAQPQSQQRNNESPSRSNIAINTGSLMLGRATTTLEVNVSSLMSPNRTRIMHLTDRLQGLQQGIEEANMQRLAAMEMRLKDIDEAISNARLAEDKQLKLYSEQLARVSEGLENEKRAREILAQSKSKEIQIMESRIQLIMDLEKKSRKDTMERVRMRMDEKIAPLMNEISSNSTSHHSSSPSSSSSSQQRLPYSSIGGATKRASEYAAEALARLHDSVAQLSSNNNNSASSDLAPTSPTAKTATTSSSNAESRIIRKMREEVELLQLAIAEERRAREQAQELILRMMEEMTTRLRTELQRERKEREATEEQLLTLLENQFVRTAI